MGYDYWQSRYGGRTDVIGKTIRLDDDGATIVGVVPAWSYAATQLATLAALVPAMRAARIDPASSLRAE